MNCLVINRHLLTLRFRKAKGQGKEELSFPNLCP